tara:strand:+ start:4233 stop:5258 length:1026 start_codon:yes stop_codon:yes gene_type:complete
MIILVTGAAGFIGFNLCKRIINKSNIIIGVDNVNSYYDTSLKNARLNKLKEQANKCNAHFFFFKINLEDSKNLNDIFEKFKPEYVFNLAAQAGVRYSLENPKAYLDSNILGFTNILEASKEYKIKHLLYASSSSVYGGCLNFPFSEDHNAVHPVSLYAATKRANELLCHTYSHLYHLPATGLRFFTVYGPWGRPDMALFLFTKSILENKPIKVFNNGDMLRDFTYIDDVVESLVRLIEKIPKSDNSFNKEKPLPSSSWAPHKIFNIGNSNPVKLMDYISAIEKAIGKKAIKEYLPMQPGDVKETMSDSSALEKWINFSPKTNYENGIKEFVDWFKDFYDYN